MKTQELPALHSERSCLARGGNSCKLRGAHHGEIHGHFKIRLASPAAYAPTTIPRTYHYGAKPRARLLQALCHPALQSRALPNVALLSLDLDPPGIRVF